MAGEVDTGEGALCTASPDWSLEQGLQKGINQSWGKQLKPDYVRYVS